MEKLITIWIPVNKETGQLDYHSMRTRESDCMPLIDGWSWTEFNLKPSGRELGQF